MSLWRPRNSGKSLNFRLLRLHELVGEATIVRESAAEGEVIRQGVRPGGVLTADVCVLDDISRAPGEARGRGICGLYGAYTTF